MTRGRPRSGRRLLRATGVVALFTLAGSVVGGIAFLGVFALAGAIPTYGFPDVRTLTDVFQAVTLGGAILLLPMLIAGLVMTRRRRDPGSPSEWITGAALFAAFPSASICPLVLGGIALAGIGVDSGLAQRMLLGAAVLAICGWMGGFGGALAVVRLGGWPNDPPAPDVFG